MFWQGQLSYNRSTFEDLIGADIADVSQNHGKSRKLESAFLPKVIQIVCADLQQNSENIFAVLNVAQVARRISVLIN